MNSPSGPLEMLLRRDVIAEAERDYLGLWWIVRKLQEHRPGLSAFEGRAATLEFLRPLLQSGELVAGELSSDGSTFFAWDGTASEIVSRIAEAWPAGGADPDIGEIVWLTTPS